MSHPNANNTSTAFRAVPPTRRITRSVTAAAASNPSNSAQASASAPTPISYKDSTQFAAPARRRKVAKKSHNAASTSPSRPTHAPRPDVIFPAEIWAIIIGFLHERRGGKAVANIARLSPLVRYEAEAILYRAPVVISTDAAIRFAETVAECPRRAHAVKTLVFQPYGHRDVGAYYRAIRTALLHTPRLSILDTSLPPMVTDHGKAVVDLIRGLHLPLRSILSIPLSLTQEAAAVLRGFEELEELAVRGEGTTEDTIVSIQQLGLPRLRILEADTIMLQLSMHAPGANLTHLSISTPCSQADLARCCTAFGGRLVSLRARRELREFEGRMYPTQAFPWARMPRLKYLHIEDFGRPLRYVLEEQPDLRGPHPTTLETLVWKPVWARGTMRTVNTSTDGDSEVQRRIDIRRFSKRVLQTWPALKVVVYGWRLNEAYQCWISSKGRGKEWPATPKQLDPGAWARVSA